MPTRGFVGYKPHAMAHGRYVYVHTFGCQMNVYDTERMLDVLRSLDYAPTDDPTRADLILLNTCSVREKAEDKALSVLGRYEKLRESNPDLLIGLGGCMASRVRERIFKLGKGLDIVFGPDNIPELPDLVRKARARRGRRVASAQFVPRSRYRFPRAFPPRDARTTAMVTVMKGCDKFCSFCIVPFTRGREVSKSPEEVVAEVRRLVDAGVREVMLLGQNVNSYGRDLSPGGGPPRFAELLARVHAVERLERIRFTTSHPWDASEDLALAFRDLDKLCPYLHLPLQSGSDRILKKMRRGHTFAQYQAWIERLRLHRPDIALSTDLIVGFPGESDRDFQRTLDAMEAIRFDSLFIFKYSVRPGTAAARLTDDVPPAVKQERLEEVMRRQRGMSASRLESYVGRTVEILVEGPSQRPDLAGGAIQLSGRTPTNIVVNVDLGPSVADPLSLVGELARVRIERARAHSLAGALA